MAALGGSGFLNSETSIFEEAVRSFESRKVATAVDLFSQAESLGCDPVESAAYRWQCWMLLGNFERAWHESDAIACRGVKAETELWDGQPFDGKRVLIRCLHGYGDAIQFLRYLPLLAARAARVIVQTHPEMVALVRCFAGVDGVVSWSDPPSRDEWDQQIEVTELPRVFRSTLASIPSVVPYIQVSEAAIARSRRNLRRNSDRPSIGLLWASSAWNPQRCTSLSLLCALFQQLPECDFYSFQRGEARAELFGCAERDRIHDTALHSPEIVDTAADLMNIDLLITVDTMAAHLAGALARPVCVLLPFEADWRWMLDRCDSPWYPTMRLIRQPAPGDWGPVIEQVGRLAERLCGQPTAARYSSRRPASFDAGVGSTSQFLSGPIL